jgi:hypothetical protein
LDQLANKTFTAEHGVTSSIIDYLPPVLPANRSAPRPSKQRFKRVASSGKLAP